MRQLILGTVVDDITYNAIENWLSLDAPEPACYPDVASEIADWISAGYWHDPGPLAARLWNATGMDYRMGIARQTQLQLVAPV